MLTIQLFIQKGSETNESCSAPSFAAKNTSKLHMSYFMLPNPMSRSVLDFHWEGGFSSAFPPTNIFFIVLRGMGVGRKDFVGGFRLPCAPWLRA